MPLVSAQHEFDYLFIYVFGVWVFKLFHSVLCYAAWRLPLIHEQHPSSLP